MKQQIAFYVLSVMVVAALGVAAMMLAGCTYNQITFHPDSVCFADTVATEPGSSGNSEDSGDNAPATTGGTGKLSPGGSNLLDGSLQFALIIQQGGETPSQTTPTVTVSIPASVVPGTGTGG